MADQEKSSTKNTAQTKTSTKTNTTTKSSASAKSVEQTKSASAKSAKSASTAEKTTKAAKSAPEKAEVKTAAAEKPVKKTAKTELTKTEAKVKTEKKTVEDVAVNEEPKKSSKTEPKETVAETKTSKKQKEEVAAFEEKAETAKKEKKEKKTASERGEAKRAASETKSSTKANGNGTATMSKKNIRTLIIVGASVLMVLILVLSLVFGLKSCNDNLNNVPFAEAYKNETRVEYQAEVIGTVDRNIPTDEEISDGGLVESGQIGAYPTYGKGQNYTTEQKNLVIRESGSLCAKATRNAGGTYDKMDKDGFLYLSDGTPVLDSEGNHRQLYKHSASVGLYLGNVADDEQAVIKKLTLKPRGYDSYSVTGLYAPAGEVIKIEISEEDMEANKVGAFGNQNGILVHIGQALYNRKANNIWAAKGINRMPHILNSMLVTKANCEFDEERRVYTAYVGSYLGGPIFIHNTTSTLNVTISGAVEYSHFILGYTTPEEFERTSKSSAPYFDLEVWEYGVLHSGPKSCAEKFSYDDLYKAAVLWEKIALVSTQNRNQGIVFLYDSFVAAGAAVAFPGQMSVNCPYGWMSSSLNYEAFINSGAWGNMHEYNHNFQNYGVGAGGEVTNNAMTLVEYSLFTRISRARSVEGYGVSGLGGWNRYTSATWALNEVKNKTWGGNGQKGLSLYAALLHNLGQDNFIQSKVKQQTGKYGESYLGYMRAWTETTHNNMSFFFNEMLGADISSADIEKYTDSSYPMFVPIASVYQTGRSYMYDGEKKYFDTMQPYVIPYGEAFEVDLSEYVAENGQYVSGSVVLPTGFEYRIKEVSGPANGTISNLDLENKKFVFNPNSELLSGKIVVTIEITDVSGRFDVDDVDLVLEFEQSHDKNKTTLQRTTYSFTENKYTTAVEAYEANFSGYKTVESGDNVNPKLNDTGRIVQDCNSEIWFLDTIENDDRYQTDGVVPEDIKSQVVVLSGKLYIDDTAKYRFSIRGRMSVALYLSIGNANNFELAAEFNTTNPSFVKFPTEIEGGYKDYELEAETWVYFRAVLVRNSGDPRNDFVGVGWGKFTPPAPVFAEDGETIIGEIPESVNVGYAFAYRNSYDFNKATFESDYFYKRTYNYDYKNNVMQSGEQTLVNTNYAANVSYNINNFPTANLTDGNVNSFIHTNGKNGIGTNEQNPLVFTIDMGEAKAVNRMTIFTQNRPNGDWYAPKSFTLFGSLDGEEFFEVGTFKDVQRSGTQVTVNFDTTTFRYYRLSVIGSTGKYVIIGEIQMWNIFELNGNKDNLFSPSNEKFSFKGSWTAKSIMSKFGTVYIGKKGATMEFEFTGTHIGFMTSKELGGSFEVYVDGNKIDSINVIEDSNSFALTYLSQKISEGTHKVVVKCLDDNANIGAIATW